MGLLDMYHDTMRVRPSALGASTFDHSLFYTLFTKIQVHIESYSSVYRLAKADPYGQDPIPGQWEERNKMKVLETSLEHLLTKNSRVANKVETLKNEFTRIQDEEMEVRQEVNEACR